MNWERHRQKKTKKLPYLLTVDYGGMAQQMVLKNTLSFINLLCNVLYHLIMCTTINK